MSLLCQQEGLIHQKVKHIPNGISKNVSIVTIENAGVYHKTGKDVTTGNEFIRQFQDRWITDTLTQLPNAKLVVVSEEKYSFTPDLFKGATRSQRKNTTEKSIAHLQTEAEMLNEEEFCRSSIVGTQHGKRVVSTYIPKNAHKLSVNKEVDIIFDSELYMSKCTCDKSPCSCDQYSTPMICHFTKDGLHESNVLETVHQRKGEAECAQIDWVVHLSTMLHKDEIIMSIVSSADIDAVVLHLFAISQHMPRKDNGDFINDVYVVLKKTGHQDIYHITGIIRALEKGFNSMTVAPKVAMALSMAGNDFLRKYYGFTHFTILRLFCQHHSFQEHLFDFKSATLDEGTFLIFLNTCTALPH